jgi:hypothetical protein
MLTSARKYCEVVLNLVVLSSFLCCLKISKYFRIFQVEDAVNRATDNSNATQELDILSFRAQLGPLTTVRVSIYGLHQIFFMIITMDF